MELAKQPEFSQAVNDAETEGGAADAAAGEAQRPLIPAMQQPVYGRQRRLAANDLVFVFVINLAMDSRILVKQDLGQFDRVVCLIRRHGRTSGLVDARSC